MAAHAADGGGRLVGVFAAALDTAVEGRGRATKDTDPEATLSRTKSTQRSRAPTQPTPMEKATGGAAEKRGAERGQTASSSHSEGRVRQDREEARGCGRLLGWTEGADDESG